MGISISRRGLGSAYTGNTPYSLYLWALAGVLDYTVPVSIHGGDDPDFTSPKIGAAVFSSVDF